MRTSYFVALVVLLAATFKSETSSAWTISVDCQMNPVPPPTIPYQNVDCIYAWQQGGVAANAYGKADATLQFWDFFGPGQPTIVDHIETPRFLFSNVASPFRTWIQCSDNAGSFRAYMNGYLYKYIVGGLGGTGYWSLVESTGDAEFTYIYAADHPCP